MPLSPTLMRSFGISGASSSLVASVVSKVRRVAVVHAEQRRAQPQGAVKLLAVMDFEQHVHAVREGGVLDVPGRSVIERGHDDQDAVRAMGAGLRHLIGVVHEILAQHRQRGQRRAPQP